MQRIVQSTTCTLSLSRPAKSSGGDKYSACFQLHDGAEASKDRAIYVPQEFSRFTPGKPEQQLSIVLQTEPPTTTEGWFTFKLLKKAKGSGDDRYSAGDAWNGDIYLPKEFRSDNETVWLRFNEFEQS